MNQQEKMVLGVVDELNHTNSKGHPIQQDKRDHYYTKLLLAKYIWIYYVLASGCATPVIYYYLNPKAEGAASIVKFWGAIVLILMLCILLIQHSRIILTEDTLIIRKLFTRKIPLALLRQVAATRPPEKKDAIVIFYTDKRPVKIGVSAFENGAVFFEMLFKKINGESLNLDSATRIDVAAKYDTQLIGTLFESIFLIMLPIIIFLGTLSGIPERMALKVFAPERIGDTLSFLYVTYWKNMTILLGMAVGILVLSINIVHSFRKGSKYSKVMTVLGKMNHSVKTTTVKVILLSVVGLGFIGFLDFVCMRDEHVLENIADYGADIKNYKDSNFMTDTNEVYFNTEEQDRYYPEIKTKYEETGYYSIAVGKGAEAYPIKYPASLGADYMKTGYNKYKLEYLPKTHTLVSAAYADNIFYNIGLAIQDVSKGNDNVYFFLEDNKFYNIWTDVKSNTLWESNGTWKLDEQTLQLTLVREMTRVTSDLVKWKSISNKQENFQVVLSEDGKNVTFDGNTYYYFNKRGQADHDVLVKQIEEIRRQQGIIK